MVESGERKAGQRTALGILVGATVLIVSLLVAGIALAYLTEYGSRRLLVACSAGAAGVLGAALSCALVSRFCRGRRCTVAVILALVLLSSAPCLSMVWPGRVSYSRFGLTVYGIIPVPFLDITVGPSGVLWFRDKSHFVSIGEVESLLTPGVDVLVIGNGWNGAVRVDPAVARIEGVEVHILSTPEAYERFNRLVSEKRKVALIAHSTC